jgi:hypothetical protein
MTETAEDKKFNETLKRMLKTPPKPHEKAAKQSAGKQKKAEREAKQPNLNRG